MVMTFLDAAIVVLKALRRPMSVNEITATAIRRGLVRTRGITPTATMTAALYLYARDTEAPILQREFEAGTTRAARNSVKWRYVGPHR